MACDCDAFGTRCTPRSCWRYRRCRDSRARFSRELTFRGDSTLCWSAASSEREYGDGSVHKPQYGWALPRRDRLQFVVIVRRSASPASGLLRSGPRGQSAGYGADACQGVRSRTPSRFPIISKCSGPDRRESCSGCARPGSRLGECLWSCVNSPSAGQLKVRLRLPSPKQLMRKSKFTETQTVWILREAEEG